MPMKKPARLMRRLASRVGESEMAVKSKVSAVRSALSTLERVLPVPLASKEILVRAPVVEISQSEVSIAPVPELFPKVKAPEMLAVPPTSNMVLITAPALMPRFDPAPVSSTSPETEAWSKVKAKAPPVMVVSASRSRASSKSMKSRESAVTVVLSVPQENFPVEASQFKVSVAASQSERPEPYVVEEEAYPEAQMFPDTEALPSKCVLPSTSRRPVIRRSLDPVRKELVVVPVPNLEYAADEKPPTWRVLPVRR